MLAAVNTLAAGVILVKSDGTCVLMNPAAQVILNTKSVRKGEANILDIAPKGVTRNVIEGVLESCRSKGPVTREFKLNGITYKITASPAQDEEASTKYIVLTIENIFERTHVEKKKDELLALVSHELRTPLCVIKGYLDIIAEDMLGPINHEMNDTIKVMQEQCTNLDLRIKDLIRYSGLSRAESRANPEVISILPFLESFVQKNKENLKSSETKVTLVTPDPDLSCYCDAGHLNDILRHLIDNAIKFSSSGVSIEVKAETFDLKDLPPSEKRIISSDPHPEKSWMRLEVEDNGPGIPPENINQIFESFEQGEDHLTRKSRGLGLGLALVKEIVSTYDGSLWINSMPNRGTEVSLLLPRMNPNT